MRELKQLQDLATILSVVRELNTVFSTPLSDRVGDLSAYAEKLQKNAIVNILKDDGIVLGFYAVYANNQETREAYLTQICVLRSCQGKGYGRELLNHCEQVAIIRQMVSIRLEVDNTNEQAIVFYEKQGYVKTGDARIGESSYMVKKLV